MGKTFKILIVDDHPLVRDGLARLVEREADLSVCGEAADAPGAMRMVSVESPDLVIVDLSLKTGSGIDLIKRIKGHEAGLPVLVVSRHDDPFHAERALRAGATGYLTKQEAGVNVVKAIRRSLMGEIYVSERLLPRLMKRLLPGGDNGDPIESLSDRELEVFQMIGEGRGTQEIADQLNLSVKTIETHREHIKDKLDLRDARELVRYAMRWNFSRE